MICSVAWHPGMPYKCLYLLLILIGILLLQAHLYSTPIAFIEKKNKILKLNLSFIWMFVIKFCFFASSRPLVCLLLNSAKFSSPFRKCKCHNRQNNSAYEARLVLYPSAGDQLVSALAISIICMAHTMRYVFLLPCRCHCLRKKLPDRRFFVANIFFSFIYSLRCLTTVWIP